MVRLAHQPKPVVILMDIDLHATDAFDATQHIKARLPGTKVIMVSVAPRVIACKGGRRA